MINAIKGIAATDRAYSAYGNTSGPLHSDLSSGLEEILTGKEEEKVNKLDLKSASLIKEKDKEKVDNEKNGEESPVINYGEITDKINNLIQDQNRSIEFSLDNDSKQMVMKVMDKKTNKVVQQIPPETTLKLAKMVASILDKGLVANATV